MKREKYERNQGRKIKNKSKNIYIIFLIILYNILLNSLS